MPTISDDQTANHQALDFIQQYLDQRGMDCSRFAYNGRGVLLATSQPGSRSPLVTLYAHTDVVSATEQAFSLLRQGEKLFGRGTYDMKFAIAAYLRAVDQLQKGLNQY